MTIFSNTKLSKTRSTSGSCLSRVALVTALVLAALPAAAQAGDPRAIGWGTFRELGNAVQETPDVAQPPQSPLAFTVDLGSATQIASGHEHSLALLPDGVYTVGSSNSGIVGSDGKPIHPPYTWDWHLIPNTADVTAIAAGDDYSLLLRSDGTVSRFGASVLVPTNVAGLANITSIDASRHHAIALDAAGAVWAIGAPTQLGDSTQTSLTNTPVKVKLPNGIKATQISAGTDHSLALLENGDVYAWGGNAFGQIGDNTQTTALDPVKVIDGAGIPAVAKVEAGGGTSFALRSDGTFRAWGWNGRGPLGLALGNTDNVLVPTAPSPSSPAIDLRFAEISVNSNAVFGRTTTGRVYSWGSDDNGNSVGALGARPVWAFPYDGSPATNGQEYTDVPLEIPALQEVTRLSQGVTGQSQIVLSGKTDVQRGPGSQTHWLNQQLGTTSAPQSTAINKLFAGNRTLTSVRIEPQYKDGVPLPGGQDFQFDAGFESVLQIPFPFEWVGYNEFRTWIRFTPSGVGERVAQLVVQSKTSIYRIPLLGNGVALSGGPTGATGKIGAPGAAGPAGPAGKDGTVTFVSGKAKSSVKRGKSTSLSFSLKNATADALVRSTATVKVPKSLKAGGTKTLSVSAVSAGATGKFSFKLKVGSKARVGRHTVTVRIPLGTQSVTATTTVEVVR